MGSDFAPFFANLFLFFYESKWMNCMKTANQGLARKLGNIFRFIVDLTTVSDGVEFENHLIEMHLPEVILNKGNA